MRFHFRGSVSQFLKIIFCEPFWSCFPLLKGQNQKTAGIFLFMGLQTWTKLGGSPHLFASMVKRHKPNFKKKKCCLGHPSGYAPQGGRMGSHCLPKLMFFTHCVKRPPPPLCFTQSCCGFFDITVEKCVSVCCDKLPHNSAKISGKNVKSTLKFYPSRFFFCVNLRLAEGTQCRKVKKCN